MHTFLVRRPQITGSPGKYEIRLEDNIKINQKIECVGWWIMFNWMSMRVYDTVMNIWFT
jgi:hypothetical protein